MPIKRGRPRHVPTDELRRQVQQDAQRGLSQAIIGRRAGISLNTLTSYYRAELDRGDDDAKAVIAQTVFQVATGRFVEPDGNIRREDPNVTMLIFLSKVRLGWKEPAAEHQHRHQHQGQIDLASASTEELEAELAALQRKRAALSRSRTVGEDLPGEPGGVLH